MKKRVAVLGATGSIGKSTLDVLRNEKEKFQPVLFTANNNSEALLELKKEFPQALTALASDGDSGSSGIDFLGKDGLLDAIAASKADITVNGISGAAGLEPSAAVIKAGSDLALANKETVVMAAGIIFDMARENKVNIIPVDSEHSAIFALLKAHGKDNTGEIILTASGGPFRKHSLEALRLVTPKEALAHPTWNMGPKITVDSATMANKGLEVIEAAFLFGFPPEKIKVTLHPQSLVHSMIRLKNGAVYAQMSKPDMRLQISQALHWPETVDSKYGILDFDSWRGEELTFEKCDLERYPMLTLAYEALKKGPPFPVFYNAANEIAVEAFFAGKIGFLEISSLVGYVLDKCQSMDSMKEKKLNSIESILSIDREAREIANQRVYRE